MCRSELTVEREADGRWIAAVEELPGVVAYGSSRDEAVARASTLAAHVLADRRAHGEACADVALSPPLDPPLSADEGAYLLEALDEAEVSEEFRQSLRDDIEREMGR